MSDHKRLLNELESVMHSGVKTRDQANNLLVMSYNAITELIDQLPEDRTEKQSSSRWLYLENIANQLNNAGIDRQRLLDLIRKNAGISAQNDKDTIYVDYWRPVHVSLYPEKKRLSKVEIQKVYECMNNHCAGMVGISAPWPDKYGRGEQ